MSLVEMVSRHPLIDDVNEELVEAGRHAMLCSLFCTSCADACGAEDDGTHRDCIRTCLDCADICMATARLAVRNSIENVDVMRAQLEMCILACERCATQCEKHDSGHCALCAKMCRECAADCRKALPSVHNGHPAGFS
ncbi:four-helix bundle copper-binding protein [Altericroceibacterium endophyticum]|uniref:Four-helix bundle copper-binding protein n=1 Tax=Altericroceibacterium endophyticum TaxID=1808508 RepID=A0A6I4T772_9SPHN|nr:four-helix bundle copper-binding protein [Altericroceibacterium endophyticum]MXO65700.1 four-helix bundle copper-binding protein [Altericroceibacterium endophyticum]